MTRSHRISAALALGLIVGIAPAQAQAPAKAPPAPRAVAAAPTAPQVSAVFSAERAVSLATNVDGRVLSVPVQEGARVNAGALLIQLDDREQRARVDLAATAAASDAEIRAAAIKAQEANARLSGTQGAAQRGAATDWELRQARAAADQAAAEGKIARDRRDIEGRRLRVERASLENYVLRAPFAGRVTQVTARAGGAVRRGQTLATVVDMASLRGEAFVPARFYGLLKVGHQYTVRFLAPFNVERRATLTYIDPVLSAGSFRVVFKLANADERLPAGLEARVLLDSGKAS
jgi:membrane fusion protein, multidrug efflux system